MYVELKPSSDLIHIVDCFWQAHVVQQTQLIVPDGCQDWIFSYGQNPTASLIGSMTQAQSFCYTQPVTYFGLRFKPGALSLFSRMPMTHITDLNINLYDAFCLSEPTRQAFDADNLTLKHFANILILTTELRRLMAHILPQHYALIHTFRQTQQGQIQQIAQDMHVSRRQFQRLFNAHFGYCPRFYSKVMRFNQLVNTLHTPQKSLADIALDNGYFDQAHMCRDIKQLSGLTPNQLIKRLPVPNVQLTDENSR